MKRVVVTGIGLLSSIGNDLDSTWNNLINKVSGIKKIKHFDTSDLSCKIAGYISHDPDEKYFLDRSIFLDNKEINKFIDLFYSQ